MMVGTVCGWAGFMGLAGNGIHCPSTTVAGSDAVLLLVLAIEPKAARCLSERQVLRQCVLYSHNL